MSRAFLAVILSSSLWGQTADNVFDKAPPELDAALRDRMTRFYQAHVEKKFREADQYVADDTKDFYYEANKPAYLSFRIDKITYSDNFKKAKAIVMCKMRLMAPGFTETPMEWPTPSAWKLENGQWYWYVDQTVGRETPFGRMPPMQGTPTAGGTDPVAALAAAPTVETLWKSVAADKQVVHLNAQQLSTDQVLIANKMPGVISLALEGSVAPGLKVNLDRMELKAGEQAKVTVRYQPGEHAQPKQGEFGVRVQPTNQLIRIGIEFQ